MRVRHAHDGRTIEVKQPLPQFNGIDDLLDSISLATGIASDGIICMSAQGIQLTSDLLATLSVQCKYTGSDDIDFFVFNRDYLYADVEAVVQGLAEAPALMGPVSSIEIVQPPTPRSLEAIIYWNRSILEHIQSHAATSRQHHAALSTIQRSTSVALYNLLSHSETVRSEGSTVQQSSSRDLQRMGSLLQGYQRELDILSLVNIHPRLSTNHNINFSANANGTASNAQAGGAAPTAGAVSGKRTLGDFVSRVKMDAVAEACNRVYGELKSRLDELQSSADQLEADTMDLRREVDGTSIHPSTETMEQACNAERGAERLATFLINTCSPDDHGWPVADKLNRETLDKIQSATEELLKFDAVARESVSRLTADKNDMMARSLALLGDISSLQSDFADLAAGLAAFDGELHSSRVDGFRHLARLSNILWAYGATVVEAVRRREFSKHFLDKGHALAELMARVSTREKKRRLKYHTDVAGQLPWEIKGMDEAPPSLEISTTRASGSTPELQRDDIDALIKIIEEIETTLTKADRISGDSSSALHLIEVKKALRNRIARINEMDDEFAAIVEENLLGLDDDDEADDACEDDGSQTSSLAVAKRRSRRNADKSAAAAAAESSNMVLANERREKERLQQEVQELLAQMDTREKQDLKQHQSELTALRSECSAARTEARDLREELERERHDAAVTRSAFETMRGDVETEKERRINMQEELAMLRKEALASRKEEEQAKREAAEEAERLAELELHLHDVQAELEAAKAARTDASDRIESLLSEGNNIEKELSAAQERIEDLSCQLEAARQEAREARDAHAEAEAARERAARSYRAEADSDRAILEDTLRARSAEIEALHHELSAIKESAKIDSEAVHTLRSQLRGADEAHEDLVKTMEAAKDACAEADFAKRHAEREKEQLHEAVRPLLESHVDLQNHLRSLPVLSSSRTPSGVAATPAIGEDRRLGVEEGPGQGNEGEAEIARQAALNAFTSETAKADVEITLAALRAFAVREDCNDVKRKLDILVTLVRKWQKTYKRHTQEATSKLASALRDRIAFRNFQVGDLALFLPSRNNVLDPKPWAAFNISFPHFFLNAPAGSTLASQLRTKEWIVAKIVRITERVTDSNKAGGNPFQLLHGVRFCLLDVDGWNPAPPGIENRPAKSRQISAASLSNLPATLADSTTIAAMPSTGDKGADIVATPKATADSGDRKDCSASERLDTETSQQSAAGSQPALSVIDEASLTSRPLSASAASTSHGHLDQGSSTLLATASGASALTRAIRAAGSRSSSQSREPVSGNNRGFVAKGSGYLKDADIISRSASGNIESSPSSTAPAFGVRSRRRLALNGGTASASTATSPALSSRAHDLNYEAMGNPFSASPGGFSASLNRGTSAQQSPLRDRAEGDRQTLVSDDDAAKFRAQMEGGTTRRSPSLISFQAGALSIAPGSPGPPAALPIEPSASLALAHGETSSASRIGSGGDDLSPHLNNASGSGLSSGMATSISASRPRGALNIASKDGVAGRSPHLVTSSQGFLSRTFGRRFSARRPTHPTLHQTGLNEPGPTQVMQGTRPSSPANLASASASQILKKLSELQQRP